MATDQAQFTPFSGMLSTASWGRLQGSVLRHPLPRRLPFGGMGSSVDGRLAAWPLTDLAASRHRFCHKPMGQAGADRGMGSRKSLCLRDAGKQSMLLRGVGRRDFALKRAAMMPFRAPMLPQTARTNPKRPIHAAILQACRLPIESGRHCCRYPALCGLVLNKEAWVTVGNLESSGIAALAEGVTEAGRRATLRRTGLGGAGQGRRRCRLWGTGLPTSVGLWRPGVAPCPKAASGHWR